MKLTLPISPSVNRSYPECWLPQSTVQEFTLELGKGGIAPLKGKQSVTAKIGNVKAGLL